MKLIVDLPHFKHEQFYREAGRAKDLDELNESAGMKHLVAKQKEHAVALMLQKLRATATVEFHKSQGSYYMTVELPNVR